VSASKLGRGRRWTLAATASALAVSGLALTADPVEAGPGRGDLAKARFFSFNDFHGALDAPPGGGTSAGVNGVPAGGAEYLATTLKALRADAEANGQKVITAGAGDMVGATPLLSAAFHDEPTIETLNLLRMDVTSVGNHEFDEGVEELLRLQNGGCHPVDGCQDGDPYLGAEFPYLAANTVYRDTGKTILPAWTIRRMQGVDVGFIGMTLEGTPSIVNPAGITEVDFLDEVVTANKYADTLLAKGVEAIVLLLHEGGTQNPPPTTVDPSGCANFSGPLVDIVAGLNPEFDMVISGHTHRPYVCNLPDSAGEATLATSAGSNGQMVTDITASLSRAQGDFTSVSATNVIVRNGVQNPDGTWARDAQNNFLHDPALVDAETKALIDEYRVAVAPIANRVVGTISADILRAGNSAQESALGDVIADAQLAYTQSSAQAQIALMNPGGIRTDLIYSASSGGEPPGEVTYGEAFAVQPFNNLVTTQTFTGQQLKDVLEQQRFPGTVVPGSVLILQVSAGFNFSYDGTQPVGSRITSMSLNGVPIDPAATYRVTTNDFLANGGDGFTKLTLGTDRVYAPGFDVDALAEYLATGPIAPGPQNRITRIS
jgi:5'-nucleotidase